MKLRRIFLLLSLLVIISTVSAQTNYDESKVEPYNLPNLLTLQNGKSVTNRSVWLKKRRPEILSIFADCMYGDIPVAPEGLHFKQVGADEIVYGGKGVRKRILICLDNDEIHTFEAMIHMPSGEGPFPIFVGLNFRNTNDETVELEADRRWPYELILGRGFAVATATRNAIEPDDPKNIAGGVREWYNKNGNWGAISAWAWGISRIVDYLVTDPCIDKDHIAVIGHSRLGKTALWAGANDLRLSLVISNNAGCCGDAISRRKFGETFASIQKAFPHWFCSAFFGYSEDTFPADQHALAALIAPRPLYIGSAAEDLWADPKGEWLCAKSVQPVYDLYKRPGLSSTEMLAPGTEDSAGTVAFKIRQGGHGIIPSDWEAYLDFASRYFGK